MSNGCKYNWRNTANMINSTAGCCHLYVIISGNISFVTEDMSFRCKTRQAFFKFCWKWKGPPHFTIKTFQILNFSLACCLLCVVGTLINASSYLIFVNLNNISLRKRFLSNFAKNWKEHHFMVNGHRSLKLSGKGYIFMVTFRNWHFIPKIGIKNWYFSAIFICF